MTVDVCSSAGISWTSAEPQQSRRTGDLQTEEASRIQTRRTAGEASVHLTHCPKMRDVSFSLLCVLLSIRSMIIEEERPDGSGARNVSLSFSQALRESIHTYTLLLF